MSTLLQSEPDTLTAARVREPKNGRASDGARSVGAVAEDRAPHETSAALARDAAAKDMVQLFKLLSDETRLRIVQLLAPDAELHVRALCETLHESQPAVSHHLALLREAGLVAARRDGKHNFYHLVPQRCQDLMDAICAAVPHSDPSNRFAEFGPSYSPDGEERM